MSVILLEDHVINQIAAGEVVEGPASLLKELMENSLDAKSSFLKIDWEKGGQEKIVIEDDGIGMKREDLLLAIKRHATSKIRSIEDLSTLKTLGFRGEALPSIASVSKMTIRSSDGGLGTEVVIEGGHVVSVRPIARNRGTTIEVASLFFNAPARRKFLKSAASTAAQMQKVAMHLLLPYPEIEAIVQGERMGREGQRERAGRVMENIDDAFFVEREMGSWQIKGYLGSPSDSRSERRGQFLYLNQRLIVSPLIAKAVKMGYGTRLAENLHPQWVLFLTMPGESIDVNVHPQKKEVRFEDESKVFRFFQSSVERAFEREVPSFSPFLPLPLMERAAQNFPALHIEQTPLFSPSEKPLFLHKKILFLENGEKELLAFHLPLAEETLFLETWEGKREAIQGEQLLFPCRFRFAGKEEAIQDLGFSRLGIEARLLDEYLVVDSLPPFLQAHEAEALFAALQDKRRLMQKISAFFHARKKSYTIEEGMMLWEKVKERKVTPLGKPIVKKIDPERWFDADSST